MSSNFQISGQSTVPGGTIDYMKQKIDVKEFASEDFPYESQKLDPYMKQLFTEVFTGMSGRYTRLKIIKALVDEPLNINQLSKKLGYDYKSVQRNIELLQERQLIEGGSFGYGDVFFVSDLLLKNLVTLDQVLNKVDKKLTKKKKYI